MRLWCQNPEGHSTDQYFCIHHSYKIGLNVSNFLHFHYRSRQWYLLQCGWHFGICLQYQDEVCEIS